LVRRALPSESRAIARLHRETISWGLLSQLGEDVVTAFYQALTESPRAFCFVAEEDGALQGFVAGVEDWPEFSRAAIRRIWWPLLKGLPRVLTASRFRRLLETRRYTRRDDLEGVKSIKAEFLTFGTREDAARLWVGVALIRAGANEFRRRGVPRVRGVVWERNVRAAEFFRTVGFKVVSTIEIHPGEVSRLMVLELGAKQ
jgi:ribosomal protein S18 acetylase RimI-like enzyme